MTLSLPGCPHKLVPFLDFADYCELVKARIETVGERVASRRPPGVAERSNTPPRNGEAALIPFGGRAVGVAPGVAGIIECAGIDERPVQEVGLRIVGVFVGVEKIDDGEFADRQHQAVLRHRTGELVDVGVNLLRFAAEVDGLADEIALHARVRIIRAELVGLAARETGDAVGVGDDQGPDRFPDRPRARRPSTSRSRRRASHRRLSRLPPRGRLLATFKWRPDCRIALPHKCVLAMEIEQIRAPCRGLLW